MTKYGLPIIAALILTFAIFAIVRSQPVHATVAPPSPPPTAGFEKSVGAVGLVEASSENIAVSLPVQGMVTHIYVKAGDHVTKGAKLFSIDDRDLQAELGLRRSSLAMAQAKLDKLLRSPRPEEIPPAEAKVKEAEELYQDADSGRGPVAPAHRGESGCGSFGPSQGRSCAAESRGLETRHRNRPRRSGRGAEPDRAS